jgi:MFS family permease
MVLVILGLTQLPQTIGLLLLVAGLIAGLVYYLYQSRVEAPVFDLSIFKNRTFGFNSLATLISYTASYPIIFLFSLYLQYALKLNPATAGLVLSVQPLVITLSSSYFGRLSDRKNPRILAMGGMALVTLATLGLAFFNDYLWEIIPLLIIMGIGFALFGTPNNNIVFSSVKKKYFGVAGASLSTMRVVGQLIGMAFALLLLNIFIGGSFIGPDNIDLFILCTQISLILFGILCFVAILVTWKGKEPD